DGRNVDPLIGALEGEGAHQRATADRGHSEGTAPFDVWPLPASRDGQEREDPSYYDRPTLKQPVWKWYVPAYFAVGGAAGAAAVGSVAFSSPGGLIGVLGDLSGLVSGMAGVPLSGYTAVLLSNTAVPLWQQTRKALPPLFVASAMSAAASLLQLTKLSPRE